MTDHNYSNDFNEQHLILEAKEKADLFGIPITDRRGLGHNDARDAFRHAYISAVIAYDWGRIVASGMGASNEMYGNMMKDQPEAENRMDSFNNAVGRKIGSEVTTREEIAPKVYEALNSGKLIIDPGDEMPSSPFDNDKMYKQPLGIPGTDDNERQTTVTLQPLSAQFEETSGENAGSFLGGLGNIMSGVTDFFSHAFDRITGNTPRQQARAMMANDNFYRQMGLNPASLEKLLENGMESLMGKITEHLTRSGNVGSLALGRTLAQHPTMLADIMRASRRADMSASLEELFMGKDGSGGLMTDFIGNAVAGGINQLLGVGKVRTRTSSAESERSRETARNWNYSRGQQQAMVAAWVARGQRNL